MYSLPTMSYASTGNDGNGLDEPTSTLTKVLATVAQRKREHETGSSEEAGDKKKNCNTCSSLLKKRLKKRLGKNTKNTS